MIELDVGEHRDLGLEVQERAVGLVGLDHHPVAAAPHGVRLLAAAGQRQLRTHGVSDRLAARRQRVRDHRGRRRLAVRARDGDHAAHRHGLGEQLPAVVDPGRRDDLGQRGGNRRGDDQLGTGRGVRGVVADLRRDAGRAQLVEVRGLGRVAAAHLGAQRLRDQGEPAHAGAADADEVQLAPRAIGRSAGASPVEPPAAPPAPRRRSAAPRRAARPRARLRAIALQPVGIAEQLLRPARAAAPRPARSSAITTRRARVRHPARVLGLVVRGRLRVRDQDRGPARGGDLEDGAARARDHEVAGRERVGERVHVLDHLVAGRVADALTHLREVACARDVQHVHPGQCRRTAARFTDRAPMLPPNTTTALRVRRDTEPRPRCLAVGLEHRARDRAAGDEVTLALAAFDRKRKAHPAREAGEHAVREAEVAVGLAQDERRAPRHRGQPHGPGDVSAAGEHRVRADALEQAAGRSDSRRPRVRPRPARGSGCGGPARAPRGTRSGSRRPARAVPPHARACRSRRPRRR